MKATIILIMAFLPIATLAQKRNLIETRYDAPQFAPIIGAGHHIASQGAIQARSYATMDIGAQVQIKLNKKSYILFSIHNSTNYLDSASLQKSLDSYYQSSVTYSYNTVPRNNSTWSNLQVTLAYSRKLSSSFLDIDVFAGASLISIINLPKFQHFSRNQHDPNDIQITHTKEFAGANFFLGPLVGAQFSKRISRITKIFVQPEIAYHFGTNDLEVTTTSAYGWDYWQRINMGLVGFKYGAKLGLLITPFNRIYDNE